MKDGFDKSVAEKMPRIQKKRPNRPWNVDPVLMKAQEGKVRAPEAKQALQEEKITEMGNAGRAVREEAKAGTGESAAQAGVLQRPVRIEQAAPLDESLDPLTSGDISGRNDGDLVKAVETIKDLNSDFTQIIFERKAIQQELDRSSRTIEEVERENMKLKERLAAFEKDSVDNTLIEREIDFLNEQLEDADLYIQNMVGLLEEKVQTIEQESSKRRDLESRFENVSREIHEKAKLDVKVSILERDLNISHTLLRELESKLEEEYQKREPLEQEIVELKNALDRVYSSLAHIRLKAKREVYGS
jgi:DNA repair exonuclease SbcCD ATPase subunit